MASFTSFPSNVETTPDNEVEDESLAMSWRLGARKEKEDVTDHRKLDVRWDTKNPLTSAHQLLHSKPMNKTTISDDDPKVKFKIVAGGSERAPSRAECAYSRIIEAATAKGEARLGAR